MCLGFNLTVGEGADNGLVPGIGVDVFINKTGLFAGASGFPSVNKALGATGRGGGGGAALRLVLTSGVEVLMLPPPGESSDLAESKLKSGVEAEMMPSFFIGLKVEVFRFPLRISLGGFFGKLDVFDAYGIGMTGGFLVEPLPLECRLTAEGTEPLAAECLGIP